jgi:hypothetical protein
LGKNGIKEPADMGKKIIIVNQGKLLMMKIKETFNPKKEAIRNLIFLEIISQYSSNWEYITHFILFFFD